jgi:hypothetical protein
MTWLVGFHDFFGSAARRKKQNLHRVKINHEARVNEEMIWAINLFRLV